MSLAEQVEEALDQVDRRVVPLGDMVRHMIETRSTEDLCMNIVPLDYIDLEDFKQKHGDDWLEVIQDYGAVYSIKDTDMIQTIGPHMAVRTRTPDRVTLATWVMPMGAGKPDKRLHTVMVKSIGEAEGFGKDPLMEEFAPELARRSMRAHAFHFYRRDLARAFRKALRDTIACLNYYAD